MSISPRFSARVSVATVLLLLSAGSARAQSSPFVRGDVNADSFIDIGDAVASLFHLFLESDAVTCRSAVDANDDGVADLTDAVYLLDFLFLAGNAPPAPFPECGVDPSADAFDCAESLQCPLPEREPILTEWAVPWPNSRPRDPYVQSDDLVWFVGQNDDYAATFEVAAEKFTRYDLPQFAGPHNIIAGAEVWYAGNADSHIGVVDPGSGEITRIDMPDPAARDPHTLVFDQQGDIWFTVQGGNFVGKLTVETREVRLARVPTSNARPYGIVVDPSNQTWFVEFGSYKLARIDRETFEITEFPLPRTSARPRRLGAASDGTLWYVDYAGGYLGRFAPAAGESEAFDEWLMPGGSRSSPYAMTIDDLDRVWFVETRSDPNVLVGFDPRTEEFFAEIEIPSGGGTVRHMVFHAPTRSLWFGTDENTLVRVDL